MLECVVNISEGRRPELIATIAAAGAGDVLDIHTDAFHHRTVLTLVGEHAARAVAREAVALLDLSRHEGVHPRLGVVDVVPFVPLTGSSMDDALAARDSFAGWAAAELRVPCFLYGPERTLPEIRRHAWEDLSPDVGPRSPHPTAGAMCVGEREPLVAYNLYLRSGDLGEARRVAAAVRGPDLRALGLPVGERVQVSMNLVAPERLGPAQAYDAVASLSAVAGAELVGLLPRSVLLAVPPERWSALDLGEDRTIESRLDARTVRP
jgi:glutamate formiminotransferase